MTTTTLKLTRKLCRLSALSLLFLALAASVTADLRFRPIGPKGGDVRSLARDPSDPRRVYAGTVDGILYVSLNSGASWTRLEPGFPLREASLDDLLVTETGEIFASFWKVDDSGGGIARSSDRGVSFRMIGAGLEGEAVRGLARAAANPRVFAAVTSSGVFRSTDEAESFSRISPEAHPNLRLIGSVAIDPRNENSIIVGTARLAWRTDNAGRSWRSIRKGMITDSDVMTLTLDRREPATVFATACTGIWRSRNAGESWTKILGIPSVSRRTRAFAQDPNRPDTFYAGTTDGIYVSYDDAKTFARTSAPALVVNAIVSMGGGRVLAGVEGDGVLVSTDFGQTWQVSNDGFRERLIRQIVPDESRKRILVLTGADGATNNALFEMDRGSEAWRRVGLPEGREIRTMGLKDNGDLVVGTDDGVFQGSAAGPPWKRLPLEIGGVDPHPRVYDLRIRGARILAATSQGLFASRDAGVTWSLVRFGASRSVSSLALSPAGKVVVATPLGVHSSEDGALFKQVAGVGLSGLRRLIFAPDTETRILAATSRGLLMSPDAGRSWFDARTPLKRVSAVAVNEKTRQVFAADADMRTLFVSRDGGHTFWPIVAQDLPSQKTFALAIESRPDGGFLLLVAASGGGLLEARFDDTLPEAATLPPGDEGQAVKKQ